MPQLIMQSQGMVQVIQGFVKPTKGGWGPCVLRASNASGMFVSLQKAPEHPSQVRYSPEADEKHY